MKKQRAIKRRRIVLPSEAPLALAPDFAKDQIKQKQWQAFLNKSRLQPAKDDLTEVIALIRKFLMPPTLALVGKQGFKQIWPPRGPWQDKGHSI